MIPILTLKHKILNQHFSYRNVTMLINAKNRHSLCGGMLSFLESRLLLFSWASFCIVKNIKDKTHLCVCCLIHKSKQKLKAAVTIIYIYFFFILKQV